MSQMWEPVEDLSVTTTPALMRDLSAELLAEAFQFLGASLYH
jgi:hypothetical protein